MQADTYRVANETAQPATNLAFAYLVLKTPDAKESIVALSDNSFIARFVQGNVNDPAIAGSHTGLTRTPGPFANVTTTSADSTFRVGSSTNNPVIDVGFTLQQTVSYDAATNTTILEQTYMLKNNGGSSLDLRFTSAWDPDMIWTLGLAHNVAGVGAGLCYVYVRDSSGPDQAVILTDGGSSVPVTSYYGGKGGQQPSDMGSPNYDPKVPSVFTSFGIPSSWRNDLALRGYAQAGEAPELPNGDADIALEWAFTLPMGGSEKIVVRRIYGTFAMPCPAGPSCGNTNIDPGEDCESDGVDTATCIGSLCRASSCGDGYVNGAADEDCESGGVDSATCIGAMCKTSVCGDGYTNAAAGELCDDAGESATCNADCKPAVCGDGVVNVTAGEDCETGELCNPASCTLDFELGGGCAGCATGGDASWLLALGVIVVFRRRRSLLA
jgi:hypothetical protein